MNNSIEFGRCSQCGKYAFLATHRCPPLPLWSVRISPQDDQYDDETQAELIHAISACEAAEKFAAQWDTDDGHIIASGHEIQLLVAPWNQPDQNKPITVTGEMVPEYHAYSVDSPLDRF